MRLVGASAGVLDHYIDAAVLRAAVLSLVAGYRAVFVDESVPLTALVLRIFYGPRLAVTIHDFFTEMCFEPKLIYERQSTSGWRYNASIGAVFADVKLAQSFYEVTSAQATALRPAYAASSGLVAWRLGSTVSRNISPDLRLFGFARVDTVAGAANERSPLVRQTTGATFGMGVTYNWLRSEQRGQD